MSRGSKRRQVDASEDEDDEPTLSRTASREIHSPSAPKRQRGINGHNGHTNGTSSRTQHDETLSDEDELESTQEGEEIQDEDDEDVEDLEETARVREDIEREREQMPKTPPMAGVLERVEMINFMCHDHLTIELGPQLNFIIGHNGSGKSAILTAITIALGAKASSTSRGSAVKSFVKQGKSQATIEVRIKNGGVDAYRPEIYGPTIIVERTFRADGGGAWKVKNSSGRIVSAKREELDNICDWCNIQVDNPLNILTQDSARQFLTSSSPTVMYDFFLRGTHLSQLASEYDSILLNSGRMKDAIKQKKQGLGDLKLRREEAKQRFDALKDALERRNELDKLRNEMVWSQVHEKEVEVYEAGTSMERLRRKKDKVQKEYEKSNQEIMELEKQIEVLEAHQNRNREENKPLMDERERLKAESKILSAKVRECRENEKILNQQYSRAKAQLDDAISRIDKEERDAAGGRDSRRGELLNKRKQLELERKKIENEIVECVDRARDVDEEATRLDGQKEGLEVQREQFRTNVGNIEALIRSLRSAKMNHLSAYGQNMPRLIEMVKAEKRWRGKVVGPLGSMIKLKQSKWAPVLESVIGNTLKAFCVTNHRDRQLLMELRRKARCEDVPILTGSDEQFDYTAGEPEEDVLTILRVLEIEDEFVKRQLIIALHIEQSALVEKRAEGDMLLRSRPPNVRVAFSLDLFRLQFGSAGGSTQTLQPYQGPPRLSADVDARLAEAIRRQPLEEQALQKVTRDIERLNNELLQLQEERRSLRQRNPELQRRARNKHAEEQRIGEELHQDQPTSLAALQRARDELQEEVDQFAEKFSNNASDMQKELDKNAPIVKRKEEIEKLLRSKRDQEDGIGPELTRIAEERLQAFTNSKHWSDQSKDLSAKLVEREKRLSIIEGQLKQKINDAMKFCERVDLRTKENTDTFLTTQEYQKLIQATEARVALAAQQDGRSIEAIQQEVEKNEGAYVSAVEEIDDFTTTYKLLKQALEYRISKWHHFRQHIALRAKQNFSFYLQTRNFEGNLRFHHASGRLALSVKTDSALGQEGDKDPRSLSGGEKSYSTICLLLSLWEAIASPIRCLDEYDVFMDAVNRRVSTKLIADAAKKSAGTQYILISPNSMQQAALGPEVRIHRLADPERNQTTI